MKFLLLTGRFLFSIIFISSGFFHFSPEALNYASIHHVPIPEILVPFSGLIAILGGLSVAFGYKAKAGALMLFIFLLPVTFYMHNFWSGDNSFPIQIQMAAFMKNLALMGTALFIVNYGSATFSLDSMTKNHLLKCKKAKTA